MSLKNDLQRIVLIYADNGHSADPFYCEVRDLLLRKPKAAEPSIEYRFSESLWYGITDAQVALWQEAYPAVDVELELRQMGEWCKAAGARGHKQNWRRFVVNWLKRAQDRPPAQKGGRR